MDLYEIYRYSRNYIRSIGRTVGICTCIGAGLGDTRLPRRILSSNGTTILNQVMVIKLTSYSYSVHDGRVDVGGLDEYQRENMIVDQPGLLEFLGYAFNIGVCT